MPEKRWILVASFVGAGVVCALLWKTWIEMEGESQLPKVVEVNRVFQANQKPMTGLDEDSSVLSSKTKIVATTKSQESSPSVAVQKPMPTPAPIAVQLPVSFLDSVSSQVPPEDRGTVAEIANQFSEEMSAIHAPVSSPDYRKAWHDATERADATLIQQLGSDLYNRLQFQATNSSEIAP